MKYVCVVGSVPSHPLLLIFCVTTEGGITECIDQMLIPWIVDIGLESLHNELPSYLSIEHVGYIFSLPVHSALPGEDVGDVILA